MKAFRVLSVLFFFSLALSCRAQEICDNGKDDDGDGLIDLQDPDCQCQFHVQGNLLLNGSFEAFDHCPVLYTYSTDAAVIDHWRFATYINGNEADYYHNLSCAQDASRILLYDPPARPLPDGNAFVSIRQYVNRQPNMQETDVAKVYISQCLETPLIPGVSYTLGFNAGRFKSNDDSAFKFEYEPFSVAVFGNASCDAVPFGSSQVLSNGCPVNYQGWVLLGKTTLVSKGNWVQGTIQFSVPTETRVLAIGPDCGILAAHIDLADSTTVLDYYVYDIDDLHLLPSKDFPFHYITGTLASGCSQDSVLHAPAFPNATYQWYKDSIALPGAHEAELLLPAVQQPAYYNVRVTTPDTCFISQPYLVRRSNLSRVHFPTDTFLCKGDTLQLSPPLDGISYSWNGFEEPSVRLNAEGRYHIVASSDNGCSRSFDVNLALRDCIHFYMPQAFTPNGDGLNDVFRVPNETHITLRDFAVYDRWGKRVFYSERPDKGWDGTYNGKPCSPGAYVYLIRGVFNGKAQVFKDSFLLIR